jgi:hypothetical protein
MAFRGSLVRRDTGRERGPMAVTLEARTFIALTCGWRDRPQQHVRNHAPQQILFDHRVGGLVDPVFEEEA